MSGWIVERPADPARTRPHQRESDDNRLSNLRPLCPNCHAQTSTYRVGTSAQQAILRRARVAECRRIALKKRGLKSHVGSSPTPGTIVGAPRVQRAAAARRRARGFTTNAENAHRPNTVTTPIANSRSYRGKGRYRKATVCLPGGTARSDEARRHHLRLDHVAVHLDLPRGIEGRPEQDHGVPVGDHLGDELASGDVDALGSDDPRRSLCRRTLLEGGLRRRPPGERDRRVPIVTQQVRGEEGLGLIVERHLIGLDRRTDRVDDVEVPVPLDLP